jgi:hypothetical protein
MKRKKSVIDFVCVKCGKIQVPVDRVGNFDVLNPMCDCGGKLKIRVGVH